MEDRRSFDESFRVLRANLTAALAGLSNPLVVVTSANDAEGKTTTCCHLAAAFSSAGQRVVLADLDLRHPDAHRLLGAHNEFGASDVLLGKRTLETALQHSDRGAGRFSFLAAGPEVNSPADLLAGGRAAQMLEALAKDADIVLLDTPPVLPVADTLVLGPLAAGALLVAQANRTGLEALQKAKDLLIRNRTRLLGVALNRSDGAATGYAFPLTSDTSFSSENGSEPT
jgi:capsular exopolysaccharide synthesis family protein